MMKALQRAMSMSGARHPVWRYPAAVPAARRAYTKVQIYTETEQLNPVEMHKFLQGRGRELKEFLEDESEMIAAESFNVDPDLPLDAHAGREASSAKGVNEQFAKQIQALLHPDYGSEAR
ncbi:hypothetical protein GGF46_004069 [Coemansia sp. RSA 552]|nr:hypothetical protein GGF46_004069 [Coemansia sp. RSA 552]